MAQRSGATDFGVAGKHLAGVEVGQDPRLRLPGHLFYGLLLGVVGVLLQGHIAGQAVGPDGAA
jgi:hypothetical protein